MDNYLPYLLKTQQNPDNPPTNNGRLPIPDFQDGFNSSSNTLSNTVDTDIPPEEPSLPEKLVSTPLGVTFSDKIFVGREIDEQDVLQRTLEDYASVYANISDNEYDHESSESCKASLQSASKNVANDAEVSYSKGLHLESVKTEQPSLRNGREKDDHDKRINEKSFMSLPVIKSEKKRVESRAIMEELSSIAGLPRVKEEDGDESNHVLVKSSTIMKRGADISCKDVPVANQEDSPSTFLRTPPSSPSARDADRRVSRSSSKPSLHSSKSTTSLFTQGSLTMESELGSLRSANSKRKSALSKSSSHSSFRERREEEVTFDRRTLRANVDQRGLFIKPKRPESAETGTDSGLSTNRIPKRPDKKLPDIPKTLSTSKADVLQSRSPHMRQASSIASSYYETASGSTATLHTAPPSPITETNEGTPKIQVNEIGSPEEYYEDEMSPSSSDKMGDDEAIVLEARDAAKRCFDEDETFMKKESIAEFLGGIKPLNSRTLKFYMEYFDFANLKLDVAFRRLCEKLYIKGETQQVDRILESFSKRYWECLLFFLTEVFKKNSSDIVHAIAYSILLLNTDLHIAQVSSKMTRVQFIRNTMAAIHEANTAQTSNIDTSEDDRSTITSLETNATANTVRPRRSSSIKSWLSNPNSSATNLSFTTNSFSRQWELELENLLKDMYNSIKSNQILLPLLQDVEKPSSSLSPGLHRSLSHSGYQNTRLNALMIKARRTSPSSSIISGGSENDSQVRSGPSSLSLRHTSSCETEITSTITEEGEDDKASTTDSIDTDESLELYLSGAPYAKEGLLVRKHFRESENKRAKDKSWKECFVVVEKGELRMFKFDTQSSRGSTGIGAIGGGNWMANATLMGQINLCHTITNALPPPGYNRDRPFVFALLTHNGGLYFFQAGTAELVNEWVSTCNYWAARLSKEPLSGGVSNMEYGWGRCLEQSNDAGSDFDSRSILSEPRSIMSNASTHTSDRVFISEWKTPIPPSVPSNHDEASQLAALKKYRDDLENELNEHKNFWDPMSKFFHPRSPNHTKAIANWEKKSQWLLYEIVKYTTYIECIESSIAHKAEMKKAKAKNVEIAIEESISNGDDLESNENEQDRLELRDRAKLLIQRATWTPGDGYSLNLPKELLYDDAVDDTDDGIINADFIGFEAAVTAAKNRTSKNK
ncbi:14975_t:CDS:2 [Acaulospora colombiana]|uniref:14975_t:CDS:1 n=1 Tax=Acaulospora colombiana TaxID=27376 RepID=A0ACA9KCW0_9GLOM|nr:14975_t:CDS:2 [Acaulospora colombiana]